MRKVGLGFWELIYLESRADNSPEQYIHKVTKDNEDQAKKEPETNNRGVIVGWRRTGQR